MAQTGDATKLEPLPDLQPGVHERAWCSIPHPTLPLIATTHGKDVNVYSLSSLSKHSSLTGGHSRSVRSTAWKPGLPPGRLCLISGSFDSTAALWRWDGDVPFAPREHGELVNDAQPAPAESAPDAMEVEIVRDGLGWRQRPPVAAAAVARGRAVHSADDVASSRSDSGHEDDWSLELVLEGHESEIKSVAFSPSGQYLATCSRDKAVWIWEDVGAAEGDDEWETVAVLTEHEADVKAVAWCPDVPSARAGRGRYSADVLASASYDNTVRIWREDGDGEWVCVAVLEGHDGTVWGVQWEPAPRPGLLFPRLMSFSADTTIRIWSLRPDEEEGGHSDSVQQGLARNALGGIPNTMRRSLREDWACTAVLPKAHTRDVYSATWSAVTGRVASAGSDGSIVVYQEEDAEQQAATTTTTHAALDADAEAHGELDGELPGSGTHGQNNPSVPEGPSWAVLAQVSSAHGPYEINHITWCKRFDRGAEPKGEEEMLVTTADDGCVRPWKLAL